MRGDIFIGGNLFIINKNNAFNNSNNLSIGLSFGTLDDLGTSYAFSRGQIKNVNISGFKIGVLIHPNHFYIYNFKNFIIHNCKIDCVLGQSLDATYVDSGENINFDSCLFGSSALYGFEINCYFGQIKFTNCSFDFNYGGGILVRRQVDLFLTGCHLEGTQLLNNTEAYGIISATETTNAIARVILDNITLYNQNANIPLV